MRGRVNCVQEPGLYPKGSGRTGEGCMWSRQRHSQLEGGGWVNDWRLNGTPTHLVPFLIHFCSPSYPGWPRSWAFLATTSG